MEQQNSIPQIEKSPGEIEAKRLIDVLFEDFSKHIKEEKELFIIFLKGHLLLEYYLNQTILLYIKDIKNVERKGFFDKVSLLESFNKNLFEQETFSALKKLNELRNRLSHSLNFKITESEIDTVGFCIGRKYVLTKYKNHKSEEALLKWILLEIAQDIIYTIYSEIAKSKGFVPIPKLANLD